jgi:hypothetical protein
MPIKTTNATANPQGGKVKVFVRITGRELSTNTNIFILPNTQIVTDNEQSSISEELAPDPDQLSGSSVEARIDITAMAANESWGVKFDAVQDGGVIGHVTDTGTLAAMGDDAFSRLRIKFQ